MTPQEALQVLSANLEQQESGQSSHWKLMMESPSWDSVEPGPRHGLGVFVPVTWKRALLHEVMQTPFRRMGRKMKHFRPTLAAARKFAAMHGRVLDLDDLRQALSLTCVREHVDLSRPLTIAVIGDGYARLTSLMLETLPQVRVVLVNLARALWVDLMSLRRLWPDLEVSLMDRSAHQQEQGKRPARVIAIRAADADALLKLPVDGAFNVSSMQEMHPTTIAEYFRLLRASPAPATWFYCANASEKTLPDGAVSRFADYPWRAKDEILLEGLVPWSQTNYQIWPPRYFPRTMFIQHRLARLHKGA